MGSPERNGNGNGINGHHQESCEAVDWDTEGSSEWEENGEFLHGKRREARAEMQGFFMSDQELEDQLAVLRRSTQGMVYNAEEEE